MARWFWYFFLYSFLGFLLEVAFARATRSKKPDRKCFLLLPLCPVYGLGGVAIAALSPFLRHNPLLMALAGGCAATAAEYLAAVFYERALGVSFWDYSGLPGNVKGKVCLPFSAAWALLSLGVVYEVHPRLAALAGAIPAPLTWAVMGVTAADALASMYLLRATGRTESLKWYSALVRHGER